MMGMDTSGMDTTNYAEAVAVVVRNLLPGADDRIITRAIRAMPDQFTRDSTVAEVLAYLVSVDSDRDTIKAFRDKFPGMIYDTAESWALRALIWGRSWTDAPSELLREKRLTRVYAEVHRWQRDQDRRQEQLERGGF
jgi:hypothetical protein